MDGKGVVFWQHDIVHPGNGYIAVVANPQATTWFDKTVSFISYQVYGEIALVEGDTLGFKKLWNFLQFGILQVNV